LEEAQDWLGKTMGVDQQAVRHAAAEDPDLKPSWENPGGAPWQRKEE
jgi:hypothetical protein